MSLADGRLSEVAVMWLSRSRCNVASRSVLELLDVIILAAIVAIWALSLLSLAFTLPIEFISPTDPDAEAIEKGA